MSNNQYHVKSSRISFRYGYLLLLALLIFTGACSVKLPKGETPEARIEFDIEYLASDKLEGREVGTKGEQMAADYIAARFKSIGLAPAGDNGTYYQEFSFTPKLNPHAMGPATDSEPVEGRNVLAWIDNEADQFIIIGAHLDHLGYGGNGSLFVGDPAIHNGADDNASGVAGLLRIAEALEGRDDQSNYLFIAFSGEERGLWGSNYFTDNPTIDLDKVSFMINMDMVGRLDISRGLAINGTGTSPIWDSSLDKANTENIKLIKTESGVGPSDHTSFYYANIPSLHFFTGQHEDYHKPSDDADKINIDGIVTVTDMILRLISRLQDEAPLAFTETEEDNQSSMTAFTVTLGVMPDYLYDQEGLRLDGVKPGRPGGNAGLEKGDIVLKMGDIEIGDIYDYMDALNSFTKGQTIEVTYKRDGNIQTTAVTF